MPSKLPFKRPRKIDNSNKTRSIKLELTADEYEIMRSYAEGRSIEDIAKARGCRAADVNKMLRAVSRPVDIKKIEKPQGKA